MSSRPYLGTRLRRALCTLVAAAMALAPVLSTAAESHEAAHVASGEAHFHVAAHEHVADHDHARHGRDDASDAGDLLHGLTHAVHACAHAFALLSSAASVVRSLNFTLQLTEAGLAPGDAPLAHAFRPPIA